MKLRTGRDADGRARQTTVLDRITVEIPERSLTVLMGPSGSGKSTLLRLLNRLEDADGGEIRFRGTSIRDVPVLSLRRQVVLVGQQPAPFAGTVGDNLAYALRLQGLARRAIQERGEEALRQVGLSVDLLTRPADRLSVGQQQRMCLARGLALHPKALLLDEPTAPLDPASAETVLEHVAGLRERLGITVVYVTHRRRDAERLGGRVLILADGALVEQGETRAVLAQPRSKAARAFLRAERDPAEPARPEPEPQA